MEEMSKVRENNFNEIYAYENAEGRFVINYIPVIRHSDSYFDN